MKDTTTLIECVINISEGRDPSILNAMSEIIEGLDDCQLVHKDIGWDAHRTVMTIVGSVKSVFVAVEELVVYSLQYLDIRKHEGAHPKLGMLDVIPFVPITGISKSELKLKVDEFCVYLAREYKIPMITYGDLSRDPSLFTLAYLRKGGVQKFEQRIVDRSLVIDYGPQLYHHSFGVSCVTVRNVMVAYNINLSTTNLSIAKKIAQDLREIRKTSLRLKDVRFMGWYMKQYNCCQISTNIYDTHAISMTSLYDEVSKIAKQYDIQLRGSELIGMTTSNALSLGTMRDEDAAAYLRLNAVQQYFGELRILDTVLGITIEF